MQTDLAQYIQQLRVVDSHEHQNKEDAWVVDGPRDVLQDLFSHYEVNDLVSSGMPQALVDEQLKAANRPVEERWRSIAPAWETIQFTGYGEAVRIHAKELYGIDRIDGRSLRDAQGKLEAYRRPGQRLHLLRDVANLDHIQVDDFCWPCLPDASGPEFFFYDISWLGFAQGQIDFEKLTGEIGVTVTNLASLREALAGVFKKYGPLAIAVKSQHAYTRTLAWRERSDAEAASALEAILRDPKAAAEESRLCLGDWCLDRGCELAAEHNLPFKIHTGYYAGNNYMRTHRIPAGNLCDLLIKHPRTRFVLMHIAYPYSGEVAALAKHFANAFVDLCWAWSVDPYSSMDFVRKFIHAAPINKLFGYGGDTFTPTHGVAYAIQMRRWLTRALQAEVDAGYLTEPEAIGVADRLLRGNQFAVFDVAAKRRAACEALAAVAAK